MRTDAERAARGFILPTSLLVLTLLTVMLTAAFVLVSAEFRSTDNSLAGTRALAIAEAGLQTYFATNRSLTAANTQDSVRFTFSGGYADVIARKMRTVTTGVTPWAIRSVGVTTDPVQTGQVTARRVVGQMASLLPGSLPARAAMVALNGVHIRGSSGGGNPLSGYDWNGSVGACTVPSGAGADTLALSTPPGGYTTDPTIPTTPWPTGEGTDGIEQSIALAALYDSTHIDWASLLAGAFTPDYVIGSLPPFNNTTWGVGYAAGNLTMTGSAAFPYNQRSGVLVVAGNLTLAANSHWDGIIIVGGNLITPAPNAGFIIHGHVVTGLNCIVSTCPARNVLWRGTNSQALGSTYRDIFWSWCWANSGINLLAAMQPVRNTFMDNWAAY